QGKILSIWIPVGTMFAKTPCWINSAAICSQKKWDPTPVLLKVTLSDRPDRYARKDALRT
ncbi:hypothetical protein, partial [Aeromonas dhakensis]|uniref:hypothetical protein n=1 Tax=Aeromonas dhakensis TaxID=196024 RepID=UPI001BDE0104